MAAAAPAEKPIRDEWVLDVPRAWMTEMKGFTTDIGGSVMKIVYRHKDDWNELEKSDRGRLRFTSCYRGRRAEAIKFLECNCHMTTGSEGKPPMVFTTGVGSHQFAKQIKGIFNVQLENIAEFDCFVKAFTCLVKEVPLGELLYPVCTKEEELIKKIAAAFSVLAENMNEHTNTTVHRMDNAASDGASDKLDATNMFPCMLVMCGSGFGWFKIDADGTFQVVDGMGRGGRTFMAIAGALTGATTYDEVMALAEKGNNNNVDYTTVDVTRESQDTSTEQQDAGGMYSAFDNADTMEMTAFNMGKLMGRSKDDFKREDLARAYLQTFCNDVCHALELKVSALGIKHVFWSGSFIKTEIARRILTLEWRRRGLSVGMITGATPPSELHFLKHGPYLGALGCVINSVSQFLKPPSEAAAEKRAKESADATKP